MQVPEHQIDSKVCSCGQNHNWPQLPAGIKGKADAEYGPNIKALAVGLMHPHFVRPRRASETLNKISSQSMLMRSLMNFFEEVFHALKPSEADLVQALEEKVIANFDEIGMRCEGKLHWLHSASDSELNFFGIHQKRGAAAMVEFGILSNFKNITFHDHWNSYFTFTCFQQALCNSPILRELDFVTEEQNEP